MAASHTATILILLPLCIVGGQYTNRNAGLTEIPDDIPMNVTWIDLSHNLITTLGSNSFSNFADLTTLRLSNNSISIIHDDAFERVYKLRSLLLDDNQLEYFPNLRNMSALSDLNLNGNRIGIIPDDALDRLNLSRDNTFFYLRLSRNELEELPNVQGISFYTFYAYDNNLDLGESELEGVSVHFIDISKNKISDLSPILEMSLKNTLTVNNNPLGNLSSADLYNLVQSQPDLSYLCLDSCNLTTMPDIRMLKKEFYRTFRLSALNNPWVCDCRISWMGNTNFTTDYIAIEKYATFKCAAPSRHAGKLLHEIPLEDYCPGRFESIVSGSDAHFYAVQRRKWNVATLEQEREYKAALDRRLAPLMRKLDDETVSCLNLGCTIVQLMRMQLKVCVLK
ncbi:hypothetical protein CAPTEDRAFT_199878 [Capitella teleta]|uniref:LRRCT domain-containing protein n=1 Tax=Capitella teleta TaxID=283909 RepID=R7UDC1_CAPTE|nr:hypothetical protein CAPTEDRAFT_199878 [Capitella teleta]|eukprot:ELU04380.1 hypothetical protein CAPTEDRAFT_199878 [Capitella teleta]